MSATEAVRVKRGSMTTSLAPFSIFASITHLKPHCCASAALPPMTTTTLAFLISCQVLVIAPRPNDGAKLATVGQRLTVVPSLFLAMEFFVAVFLHRPRDPVEREIPGHLLEFARARRAIFRNSEPRRRVDDVQKRRPLRAERAAIDGMIRIALDVDDVGNGVFGFVPQAVDEDAAGD